MSIMFATPQRQQPIDKENVGSQVKKTPGKSQNPLVTPVRKPLANLNQDVDASYSCRSGKMLQKIWNPLKQCTPTRSTSANKTPRRHSKNHRKFKYPSLASSSSKRTAVIVTEAAESLLNQVLLKEISAISPHSKESDTAWIASTSSISDGDLLLDQTAAGLVDSAVHAALQELTNEKMQGAACPIPMKTINTESLDLDTTTPTTYGLWSIALGLNESVNNAGQDQAVSGVFLEDNQSGISSELSPAKGTVAGCSPVTPSPVIMISNLWCKPSNHHESLEIKLAPSLDQDNLATGADGEGSIYKGSHCVIQETDSVPKVVQKLEMTTTSRVELEPLMKVVPPETTVRGSCTETIEIPNTRSDTRPDESSITTVKKLETDSITAGTDVAAVAVESTPVYSTMTTMNDCSVGTTPVKSHSIFTGKTPHNPILRTDSCVMTTPIHVSDAYNVTTPIEMTDCKTPIRMSDTMTETTTSIQYSHAIIGTTPVNSIDIGLCTDPVVVTDSSTETSSVGLQEVGVGTGSHQVVDAQCGSTPVRVVDMDCGTSPCISLDASTAVTPLALRTTQTLTSPIVVPAFENLNSLDASSLISRMESACISNELLRREIQTLKTTKTELHHQLDTAKEQLERREVAKRLEHLNESVELRQTAKESLQTEIDSLLLQVGDQMNQIAFLQEALHQKSSDLSTAKQDNINLRRQYQKEIHDLQQDLCIAYKQQQQEVSDLHALYEENNYEPHYRRAKITIAELKTEMQAYTDLKSTLETATKIQEQFGCIEEAYRLVNALFTKTMDRKGELDEQHVEMIDEMRQMKAMNEKLQQQLTAAEENQHYTRNALKCQAQLLHEIDDVSHTCDEMKSELQTTILELSGYKSAYDTAMANIEDLEQQGIEHFMTECTMGAALAAQSKQWHDTTAVMEMVQSTTAQEMENLKLQNTRLVAETTDQKHQLSGVHDLITTLQSELEGNKETIINQAKELESLEFEQEMSKKAKDDAQKMARQLQQYKENVEFLEEERVALVESAREAEDQLQVTGLELSRIKVGLSKAEESGSQWKSAAQNLSEKLQFCQSELDNTKAHAHWMLLNQATEMRDAADGLIALQKTIRDTFTHHSVNVKDQQEITESSASFKPSQTKSKPRVYEPPLGSLVASVLNAIQSKEEDINDEDMVIQDTPSVTLEQQPYTPSLPENSFAIGGSSSSAFTAVETSTTSTSPNAFVEDFNTNKADGSQDDSLPLVEEVERVRTVLGRLLKLLLAQDESKASAITHLKQERSELHLQLLRSQKLHDGELCILREQLQESELQERRLHQEVTDRNASLTEQQQALQYAQKRLQSMAENLERFSDQKSTIEKLQTETAKLTSNLRVSQREKCLLQEQLDSVLSGCSQSRCEQDVEGSVASQPKAIKNEVIRENLSLKKEVERLRVCLVEHQEYYEKLNATATKHMCVLEDNWHKADAEVYRLDELFDHCKQLMEQVPVTDGQHSGMSTLRQLLS